MTKIEVKINGVNTLVDVDKLEKLENGLFADNYKEDGSIDINTESAIIEAKRVQTIKAKAGQIILAKYPDYTQTNAQLGIYGEEYLATMKVFITDIIKQSNELEADSTKTAEDFKGELNE